MDADVDRDGDVSSLDALIVLNAVRRGTPAMTSSAAALRDAAGLPAMFDPRDVDRDGDVDPLDALAVLNVRRSMVAAEGIDAGEDVGVADAAIRSLTTSTAVGPRIELPDEPFDPFFGSNPGTNPTYFRGGRDVLPFHETRLGLTFEDGEIIYRGGVTVGGVSVRIDFVEGDVPKGDSIGGIVRAVSEPGDRVFPTATRGGGRLSIDGSTILWDQVPIATFEGGSFDDDGPLLIHFNDDAQAAGLLAVVRGVAFANRDGEPTAFPRRLELTVTDAEGRSDTAGRFVRVVVPYLRFESIESLDPETRGWQKPRLNIPYVGPRASIDGSELTVQWSSLSAQFDRLRVWERTHQPDGVFIGDGVLRFDGIEVGTYTEDVEDDSVTFRWNASAEPRHLTYALTRLLYRRLPSSDPASAIDPDTLFAIAITFRPGSDEPGSDLLFPVFSIPHDVEGGYLQVFN